MKSIAFNNVHYSKDQKDIINTISFKVEEGHPITLIGDTGKTTLLKILENKLSYDGTIKINGIPMNNDNFRLLTKYYKVIYKELKFKEKKVKDIFLNSLTINSDNSRIKKATLETLLTEFNLYNILSLETERLGREESYLLKIVSALLEQPPFLILDNILEEFNAATINKIFSYCNKHHITIINITSNLETSLNTEYIYCLYKGKIILEGPIPDIFKEEKIFKRLGFNLPFIIDMSLQLNYYELATKLYTTKEELVSEVWK